MQVYGLSGPVARYIGRNGPILHRFANEDVTLGAWLVGLEVTHVDERRFCCDSAERCMAQVWPCIQPFCKACPGDSGDAAPGRNSLPSRSGNLGKQAWTMSARLGVDI